MTVSCNALLTNHQDAWHRATVHPFLTGCKDGTIQPDQFNTWLVQDYLFVKDFTRMVGRVLGAAPDSHLDALLSGLVALQDELLWFQDKAAERALNLDIPRQSTCQQYCDFMASLAPEPYPVQATALWAIELAYNQGWQLPGPMPAPYTEFADRWGKPGFTDYVNVLAAQADVVLAEASDHTQVLAETAFLKVANLEAAFWQMAFAAAER
ncbi:MAG: TenA family transcriptional regulator [Leptolyngbyaceae cyanobacterium SM2_5_2]|nr:TenA family transcriptional regulator [Leptolyngbyaceae cyanobacterium SM2_5_2]